MMCACGKCLSCASRTQEFTQLRNTECTLGDDLIDVVDSVRDIATVLGTRPYVVSVLWTRWSGGDFGRGVEEIINKTPILPTPRVVSVDSLDREVLSIGTEESGDLSVFEVSGRYTEAFLNGAPSAIGLNNNTKGIQSFWEIEFKERSDAPIKRRFTLKDVPAYDALKVQWTLTLKRALRNRSRNGDLPA